LLRKLGLSSPHHTYNTQWIHTVQLTLHLINTPRNTTRATLSRGKHWFAAQKVFKTNTAKKNEGSNARTISLKEFIVESKLFAPNTVF